MRKIWMFWHCSPILVTSSNLATIIKICKHWMFIKNCIQTQMWHMYGMSAGRRNWICWSVQKSGYSLIYSSRYLCRGRSLMQVKLVVDSLFVLCKTEKMVTWMLTTEQQLIISLQNFVPIIKIPLAMSYKNFSAFCWMKIKIYQSSH